MKRRLTEDERLTRAAHAASLELFPAIGSLCRLPESKMVRLVQVAVFGREDWVEPYPESYAARLRIATASKTMDRHAQAREAWLRERRCEARHKRATESE